MPTPRPRFTFAPRPARSRPARSRVARSRVAAALLTGLLTSAAALAAGVLDGGQLSHQMQHWLDSQPDNGTRISVNGAITGKVDGGHVRLTLPDAHLHLGQNGEHATTLDLGTLTLLATPAGGGWDVTTTLPPRMPMHDNTGAVMGELSARKQSVRGHLSADAGILEALDLSLGEVAFEPTPGHDAYTIASLALRLTPDKVDTAHWSGPVRIAVVDMALHGANGGDWRLHEGSLAATVSDFNLAQATLLRTGALAASSGKSLDGLLSHLKGVLALRDLSGRDTDGEAYALKDLDLSLNIDGDGSRVAVDYTHHGLQMNASGPDSGPLPADGRLRLVARDVPVESVAATYLQVPVPPGNGKEARHARLERRGHLVDDLAAAGTRMTLDALDFQAPTVGVAGHGTLNFSDKDPRGLDGALTLRTRGLSALSGSKGGGAALTFFAVDALGRQSKDDAGRGVRDYDLTVGQDGRIQLNGSEATALVLGLSKLL